MAGCKDLYTMASGPPPRRPRRRMRKPTGLSTFYLPVCTQVQMSGIIGSSYRQERAEEAQRLLARNTPYHDLIKQLAEKYGVTTTMAAMYVRDARLQWAKQPIADAAQRRLELERQFQTFYQVCMGKGAYASAGRALRELGLL